jgi:hypothetical protein
MPIAEWGNTAGRHKFRSFQANPVHGFMDSLLNPKAARLYLFSFVCRADALGMDVPAPRAEARSIVRPAAA